MMSNTPKASSRTPVLFNSNNYTKDVLKTKDNYQLRLVLLEHQIETKTGLEMVEPKILTHKKPIMMQSSKNFKRKDGWE